MRQFLVSLTGGALGAALCWAGGWALGGLAVKAAPALDRVGAEEAAAVLDRAGHVFEAVADAVSPAVVSVEARRREGSTRTEDYGSGVVVRPFDGAQPVVVTNLHVVGGAEPQDIEISFDGGRRRCRPTRVWRDYDTDLALLGLPFGDVPTAKLANSDVATVGQWVLVMGTPFGLPRSVTHGIVSATNRRQIDMPGGVRIRDFLQTDAPINPGNSGGPLLNLRGEVLGINTAIASFTGRNSGVGFSIPANLVRWVATELVTHGKVRRAYLGVDVPQAGDYTLTVAQSLGLEAPRGALLKSVKEGSPAAEAGLKARDVVLEFDGVALEDEDHLINLVARTEIGRAIDLAVWRGGAKQSLRIVLTERPAGR